MSIFNIPKIFQNDDTVYHYTTSENALLYILKEMKLRLSPRANSLDPIENTKEFISYSGDHDLIEIGRRISAELKNAKQLSFCKNNPNDLSNGVPTVYPFEKYGFAKPRMWDNYGDKYKGVCLALSKSKLQNSIKDTVLFDNETDVEYLKYKEFSIKHHSITWQGSEEGTYEHFLKIFKKRLFYKHEDYSMENEYRICSLSNKQYDYVNIQDSLIGLIVSNQGLNDHLYDSFSRLMSNQKNLHFLIMSFDDKKIRIQTYQEHLKYIKSVEKDFKTINNGNKDSSCKTSQKVNTITDTKKKS